MRGGVGIVDGLEERGFLLDLSEEIADFGALIAIDVAEPVVGGFGDDGDDVFDFFFEAEVRSGGEFKVEIVAADGDVFYGDGAKQPFSGGTIYAFDANPAGSSGRFSGEIGDELDAAADFGDDLFIAIAVGLRFRIARLVGGACLYGAGLRPWRDRRSCPRFRPRRLCRRPRISAPAEPIEVGCTSS